MSSEAESGPNQERRRTLLEVAARLFCEKGYSATTMKEIADASGMLKGSLYHYFPSKEEILFQIIWITHSELRSWTDPIRADKQSDPIERLRSLIKAHVLLNVADREMATVFYNDFKALPEDRQKVIVRERDSYERFLRRLIAEAQKAGNMGTDAEPRLIAFGILGLVNSVLRWYRPSGKYSSKEVAEFFEELIMSGVLQQAGLNSRRRRRTSSRH